MLYVVVHIRMPRNTSSEISVLGMARIFVPLVCAIPQLMFALNGSWSHLVLVPVLVASLFAPFSASCYYCPVAVLLIVVFCLDLSWSVVWDVFFGPHSVFVHFFFCRCICLLAPLCVHVGGRALLSWVCHEPEFGLVVHAFTYPFL